MERVRATVRLDEENAPELYALLAHTDGVDSVHVLAVNSALEDGETILITVAGDPDSFAEQARETTGVESIAMSEDATEGAHALVTTTPDGTQLSGMLHSIGSSEIVLRLPIVYRNGRMHATAVGTSDALQSVHDGGREDFPIQIESVGPFHGYSDDPLTRLSDRQREALETAYEMGYYEQPRQATHEDIADRLDCAPVTASDHLQKAEGKLVSTLLGTTGKR